MIPEDIASMKAVAYEIERAGARAGWDRPAVVGYVFEEDGVFRSQPLRVDISRIHERPAYALHLLAQLLAAAQQHSPQPRDLFPDEVRASLAGMWVMAEGWSGTVAPEERDGRDLADIPGSVEVRIVCLIDYGGRTVYVQRPRGGNPKAHCVGPGVTPSEEEFTVVAGELVDGLRDVLLYFCAQMPDGSYDRAAVEKVGE